MRGNSRGHELDDIKADCEAGGMRHVQVAAMDRVECAAEQANLHSAAATGCAPTSRHMASSRAGTPSPVAEEIS